MQHKEVREQCLGKRAQAAGAIRAMAPVAAVLLAVSSAASSPMASTGTPQLTVLRIEDGLPANRYTSRHTMSCGGHAFEVVVESPGPVRLTELKVDGVGLAPEQLQSINAQVPERSWFEGIASSCTTARQALTLRLSSSYGAVTIPLSFKDGALVLAEGYR